MRNIVLIMAVLSMSIFAGCGQDGTDDTHISIQNTTDAQASSCEDCHNSQFPHAENGPEAVGIYEDYSSSPHAKAKYVFNLALCSRCHTDEGARTYISIANSAVAPSELEASLYGKDDIEAPSPIQCSTCHDTEQLSNILGDETTGLPEGWGAEFRTCTACHQLIKPDGALNTGYHDGWSSDKTITDTHFDDPSSPIVLNGTGGIEGYIVNVTDNHNPFEGNANSGGCLDCHNPHNADNTINLQWAQSGHGDLQSKAWMEEDFKEMTGGSSGTGLQKCQRCHSSTGFRNFANGPLVYNSAFNIFTATGSQAEVLYCWACHIDNKGGMRDPGLFANAAPYTEPAGRILNVPDSAGSNTCIACHSGRSTGKLIKISSKDFTNTTFMSGHHLPAGGILFRTIGYEFDGLDYDNPPYFKHDKIGLDQEAAPGTGSSGPCVSCHMGADEGHLFTPVLKDSSGEVVSITANTNICSNCHMATDHGDFTLTPDVLNEEEEGFENSLAKLGDIVDSAGYVYLGGYPYFDTKDWTQGTDDADIGKNNMGAVFNYMILSEEPGAYAHNRFYTKRLIFDSIDWLEDGAINGTIDLAGYEMAYKWLYNGTDAEDSVTRP